MTWLYIPPQALTPAARKACSAYRSALALAESTSDVPQYPRLTMLRHDATLTVPLSNAKRDRRCAV